MSNVSDPALAGGPPAKPAPAPIQDGGGSADFWHDRSQVRFAQLATLRRKAERTVMLPVLAAVGILAAFCMSPNRLYAAGLLLFCAALGVATSFAVRKGASDALSARGVENGFRLAAAITAVLGSAWGTMPIVLFADSDPDQRMIVVATLVAIMANVYRLGPGKRLYFMYLVPICTGGAVGFAMLGTTAGFVLAALVPVYGCLLLAHCASIDAASVAHITDHISVLAQTETINDLLIDVDDSSSDWLWRTDASHRLTKVLSGEGCPPLAQQFEGLTFDTILAPPDKSPSHLGGHTLLAVMAARKPFRNLLVAIKHADVTTWWRLSGKPQYDASGRFIGYCGLGSDITVSRNSETQIAQLANFDSLTGFANRGHFQTFASRECAAAAVDGHCRALLSLDLDGFKSVNDRLGHEGGDELLRQVAARLTSCAPPGTFIARLGSDEFAVWLQPTTPMKAEAVARSINEIMSVPFDVRALPVEIGASIGIAFAPKHSVDPDDLLVKADLALYHAKSERKGQTTVFSVAFETSLIDRRRLEGDLKLALARGEFSLNYQPLLGLAQGRIVGFEALIRWHSPERGLVSPAEFIPAAESMGLIAAIGRWVLFEACRTAATWPEDIRVAVNVSPPHVRSPEFMQDVVTALKLGGLHPSRLELEVTEGVFLDTSATAVETLKTLRRRGVRIALDDFGTGYSSLNYLIDFPVDKIKIDQSFVRDFTQSHANQAIVDAMLGLARKLSIRVTAEGVETKEQALALKRRRCDELQGYLLSRPRPAGDVLEMIETIPAMFLAAVPTYMDSPLAMVPSAKKKVV